MREEATAGTTMAKRKNSSGILFFLELGFDFHGLGLLFYQLGGHCNYHMTVLFKSGLSPVISGLSQSHDVADWRCCCTGLHCCLQSIQCVFHMLQPHIITLHVCLHTKTFQLSA